MVRIPHGVRLGQTDGTLWEVFSPPWWRVDLWLRWWLSDRPKGVLTFVIDGEGERSLRAWRVKNNLPFCAEYDASKDDRYDR